MLLTLTSTTSPARDLGFLLRKHPDRLQTFGLPFGAAHVFYPEATQERCTAALFVDVDPVGLVRGRPTATESGGLVEAYVNDRPYVASSLLSVGIARVFGTALSGKSDPPELATTARDFEAGLSAIRMRDPDLAHRLFGPLGYRVRVESVVVPDGERVGANAKLTIAKTTTLAEMLNHLYVLIPVIDGDKHYWVGDEEVEKLFRHGGAWLAAHPEREFITKRYLRRAPSLARAAVARLDALDDAPASEAAPGMRAQDREAAIERPMRLQERRMEAVVAALRAAGAASVVDVGCGEGDLIAALAREPGVTRLLGTDVSVRELERAKSRIERLTMAASQRDRIELFQSSALYADARLAGLDGLTLVEVIEHVDPDRLPALVRAIFGEARPKTAIVTTPNREYNVRFASLAAGAMRHPDHRFEWTRAAFEGWADDVASAHGYTVTFEAIGDVDPEVGAPTQMGIFRCA